MPFMTENMEGIQSLVVDEEVIGIELPDTVDLPIVETAPGVRGNSATGRTKPATLSSGLHRPGPGTPRPGRDHPRRHPDRRVPRSGGVNADPGSWMPGERVWESVARNSDGLAADGPWLGPE